MACLVVGISRPESNNLLRCVASPAVNTAVVQARATVVEQIAKVGRRHWRICLIPRNRKRRLRKQGKADYGQHAAP